MAYLFNAFANAFAHCSQCKLCNSVCPLTLAGSPETASPAGAMAIMGKFATSALPPQIHSYNLDWCLLCGKCEKACPAGLPLRLIFLQSRILLEKQRKSRFLDRAKFFLYHSPRLDFLKRALFPFPSPKHELPRIPAHKPIRQKKAATATDLPTVALFSGCVAKRLRPEIAKAAVCGLSRNGFRVLTPPRLRCCGKAEGFTSKTFLSYCRKNLKILAALQSDFIAALCPSCLHSIRHVWPNLNGLSGQEKSVAAEIAAKTRYLGSFWKKSVSNAPSRQELFWHQGCLMENEDAEQVRNALNLQHVANLTENCCGARQEKKKTGKQKSLKTRAETPGARVSRACRDAIIERKPQTVITGCPHCLMRLETIFQNHGDKISVRHAAELYYESILNHQPRLRPIPASTSGSRGNSYPGGAQK